jgi:hypothetical protein
MTVLLATISTYGDTMQEGERWPDTGRALLDELLAARGRVALIAGDTPGTPEQLVDRLRDDLHVAVASLGQLLAASPNPPAASDLDAVCADATVLTDIDFLFWPALHVAPLAFLATRSRQRPTIALWPGEITRERAIYSTPGRPDYHDVALHDVIVLRPLQTRYPDEVPYEIERILP